MLLLSRREIVMQGKRDRRRYLIKKTFQLKFVAHFLVLVIFGSLVSGILLYFLASSELGVQYYSAHIAIRNTWDILKPSILITHTGAVILVSVITVYMVIYLSNRIAGPLYRLETILGEVAAGNLDIKVTLRKNDELAPLKTSVQNMIEKLHETISLVHDNSKVLEMLAPELENAIATSPISAEEKNRLITAFKESMTGLEQNVGKFRL